MGAELQKEEKGRFGVEKGRFDGDRKTTAATADRSCGRGVCCVAGPEAGEDGGGDGNVREGRAPTVPFLVVA